MWMSSRRADRLSRGWRAAAGLMVAAVISFFVPFGFLLALWPAFSAKGAARTVAIISLAVQLALILVLVTVAMNSRASGGY